MTLEVGWEPGTTTPGSSGIMLVAQEVTTRLPGRIDLAGMAFSV